MSHFLQLNKNGKIRVFTHNPERQKSHRCKNQDGCYGIFNKESKEIVAAFDNEISQSDWFYDEANLDPNDCIYGYLNDGVRLEQGFTLGNLISIISKDEFLTAFVVDNFPLFPAVDWDGDKETTVKQTAIIGEDNTLTCHWGATGRANEYTIITVDNELVLYQNDKPVVKGEMGISLLDLITAFFHSTTEPVTLSKTGLNESEPFACLMRPCVIEDGTTLEDVFDFVHNNTLIKDFLRFFSTCPSIDEFHKQVKLPKPKRNKDKLFYLQITKELSFTSYGEGTGTQYFGDYGTDFHAIGELCKQEKELCESFNQPPPNHTVYSVSATPVNELKDLPVVTKPQALVDIFLNGELQKINCNTSFTLLEILHSIYWDISFYGGPDEATAFIEEMNERVEAIKADPDGKTVPLDEIIQQLKEESVPTPEEMAAMAKHLDK